MRLCLSKCRTRTVSVGSILLVVLILSFLRHRYYNIEILSASTGVNWHTSGTGQRWAQPRPFVQSSSAQSHEFTSTNKSPSILTSSVINHTNPEESDMFNVQCQRWAVVAPFDSEWASEAVCRQVRMSDWCLVIVFDREPSETYGTGWRQFAAGEGGDTVVTMLTPQNVKLVPNLRDSEFIKAITEWNYIGRKNIGYYYAINHGAKTIWDFDDNNMLKFWIPGAAPPGAPSLDAAIPLTEQVDILEPQGHNCSTWNPYPALGAPTVPSWPRGLPLDDATNVKCNGSDLKPLIVTNTSIAVLQSLSDRQPDADDLYQAIMPFPFYFKPREMKTVLIPPYTLTPYNTRATLHFEAAFWALYLPTSVDRELSDIWRSYIAQRLFWETDNRVGFIGRPLMVQDQNIHPSLDKAAIKGTSSRIRSLINFLGSWRGKEATLDKYIEELWYALEQNNLVDHNDVEMVRMWLQDLTKVRYRFPSMVSQNSIPKYTPYETGYLDSTLAKIFPREFQAKRYTVKKNTPEYDNAICHSESPTDSLTFWTSDMHFATILDQPSILGSLGHKVHLAIVNRYDRNPFVWRMKGMHIYDRVSNVISKTFGRIEYQNNGITEKMIIDNFEFYKNDSVMASVDAFVCLYQPGMCEMWMPFNKTTIFLPAHRYNMGRCNINQTNRLNEHLYMIANASHPKHVIAASSKYDLEYLRHYTGLEVLPLYSYCLYVTDNIYAPSRDEFPIFARKIGYNNWDERFATDIKKVKVVNIRDLYKVYNFSDLVHHRALIFLPYAVMTYKLTEFYTMGIPLFIPSLKYFRTIKSFGPDRTVLGKIFCDFYKRRPRGTLKDNQMIPHPSSIHPYSPNAVDNESEIYWLQLSDFIQWPHITYFDDFKDLEQKLLTADFDKIHKLMVEENKRKKRELDNNWCKVFNMIEKGRQVPQDYSKSIRELYGVSRLQVD